jgi:stress response protein YsnF
MEVDIETDRGLVATEKSARTYEVTSQSEGTFHATFTIRLQAETVAIIRATVIVSSVKSLELISIV